MDTTHAHTTWQSWETSTSRRPHCDKLWAPENIILHKAVNTLTTICSMATSSSGGILVLMAESQAGTARTTIIRSYPSRLTIITLWVSQWAQRTGGPICAI